MTHWFRAGGTGEAFPPLAAVRVHLHGAQIVSGWVCEHATPCHRASRSRLQTERAAFVSIRSRDGVRNGEYLHSRRGNLRFPCWTGVGTVYHTAGWGRYLLYSEQSKARKVLVLHARLIVSTTTLPLHRLCQRTKATPSLLDLRCCLALTIQQGTLLPHCVENPSMRKRRPLHSSPRPTQAAHQ